MQLSIVRKSRRRSWHVLSKNETHEFIEKVYAFLALMPERFQAIDVIFHPQWSNEGGWHISGFRGEFTLGSHKFEFQFGEITRKIRLTHPNSDGESCSYFVPRAYRSDLNKFVSCLLNCLRISILEDTFEGDREWGDEDLMRFLLKDSKISSAKPFNRSPEGRQKTLELSD